MIVFLILLLALPAFAQCKEPRDKKTITETTKFCGQNYLIPNGMRIGANDILIDCGNALIQGEFDGKTGMTIENKQNVVVQNCIFMNYETGISISNSTNITITNTGLLRNNIGIKLVNSHNNTLTDNRDVSLRKTVIETNSKDNIIRYENKKINTDETDYCRYNYCNQFTREYSLRAILMKAIRAWINTE